MMAVMMTMINILLVMGCGNGQLRPLFYYLSPLTYFMKAFGRFETFRDDVLRSFSSSCPCPPPCPGAVNVQALTA